MPSRAPSDSTWPTDAIARPTAAWAALNHVAQRGGLLLAFIMSMLVMSAARRLFTALLKKHRYQFTMWRWGRVLVWMMALGALLKLGLPG